MAKKIFITGACGQIGTELTLALRDRYGKNVIASSIDKPLPDEITQTVETINLDVCDKASLHQAFAKYKPDIIFHMAGVLSALAEAHPTLAWQVNVDGYKNVLEAASSIGCAVFFPSSIGAFGPQTPADKTPQVTIQRPTSIYGITKVCGEMLSDYYAKRFGLDVRGLRLPGLISYKTKPGGGTTDYAVDIFHAAKANKPFSCFLQKDTHLDMMYMPDALRAIIELMEAPSEKLIHPNAYNITAMSISPKKLYTEIKKHIPGFTISYDIDPIKQAIADSWPNQLDDQAARDEWGWKPKFNLEALVLDMLKNLPTP